MKITYITHASLLVEVNDLKIITDPWLVGPSWGGELWHYPTHKFKPSNLPKPDIIFFSHGHEDHYHEPTIKMFPKTWFNSKIIAPNFEEKWWKGSINKKFKNVYYLNHNEKLKINNTEFQVFKNDLGDYDSSLKIKYNNKSLFLQTDNLMSFKEARRIKKLGRIDFAFVMPFKTGVFPGFYKMKIKDLLYQAKKKTNKSLAYCGKIVRELSPKYVIPYACDLGYLGKNFPINRVHTHNKNRFVNMIKKKNIKAEALILNPGNYIKQSKNKIIKKLTPYKYNEKLLIKFSNKRLNEYKNYHKKEILANKNTFIKTVMDFKKKLTQNIKDYEKINFKTQININETLGTKRASLIIHFKERNIYLKNENTNLEANLEINIDSHKIANLVKKRYQTGFMTFWNGGYICKRAKMQIGPLEIKFWNWMNNLNF